VRDLPEVVSQPDLQGYPPECQEAERSGVEGVVRLSLTVRENGTVTDVRLVRGIDPCLDAAAVRLAGKLIFKPAVATDGRPIEYRIKDYRFRFRIAR